MENKTLDLYQTFEHGGKSYKVEHAKEYKSCHGCAFCDSAGSRCTLNRIENDVPECIGLHRHDGMDVIFVEVNKPIGKTAEDYAKSIAAKKYAGQHEQDCFVEGFMTAVAINYSPR